MPIYFQDMNLQFSSIFAVSKMTHNNTYYLTEFIMEMNESQRMRQLLQ